MLLSTTYIAATERVPSASKTGRRVSEPFGPAAPRPYRALIVEDEPVLAKNIVTYLCRRGVLATAVGSGDDALRWMDSNAPDVILVDYDLPGMDGLTLIRRIRACSSAIPIVMVTGRGDSSIERRARDAGAGAYRTKPISLAEVKRLLDLLAGAE